MTRIEGPGRASGAYRRVQKTGSVASAPAPGAPPEVAAIVPAELPPHVRDAFSTLNAETDELRRTLALARNRINELEQLVEADELTPAANRRGLMRDLARTLAEVERHAIGAALVFIDVDRLKSINDVHGHIAGDAALVHVAETLRAHVRGSDVVARLGGDEFAVILRHVDEAKVKTKTSRIIAAISARPVRVRGGEISVSVSAGYHMLAAGETAAKVMALADSAMYAEKSKSR